MIRLFEGEERRLCWGRRGFQPGRAPCPERIHGKGKTVRGPEPNEPGAANPAIALEFRAGSRRSGTSEPGH